MSSSNKMCGRQPNTHRFVSKGRSKVVRVHAIKTSVEAELHAYFISKLDVRQLHAPDAFLHEKKPTVAIEKWAG